MITHILRMSKAKFVRQALVVNLLFALSVKMKFYRCLKKMKDFERKIVS